MILLYLILKTRTRRFEIFPSSILSSQFLQPSFINDLHTQGFGLVVLRTRFIAENKIACLLTDAVGDLAAMGFDKLLYVVTRQCRKSASYHEGHSAERIRLLGFCSHSLTTLWPD